MKVADVNSYHQLEIDGSSDCHWEDDDEVEMCWMMNVNTKCLMTVMCLL